MNLKGLGILFVLAAIAAGLAYMVLTGDAKASSSAEEDQALFPDLLERINDIQRIEIASNSDGVVVERADDGTWTLASKGGYPAKDTPAKELLMALARTEVERGMTSNPERYAKLGVQDADAADSTSRRVTVSDAGGAVLADVVVSSTMGSSGSYVRRADEAS